MRVKNIFKALVLVPVLGFSQQRNFTMAEAVNGLRGSLMLQNITQPSMKGKTFLQFHKNAYVSTDLATMKADTLLSLSQYNQNFTKDKWVKKTPDHHFFE